MKKYISEDNFTKKLLESRLNLQSKFTRHLLKDAAIAIPITALIASTIIYFDLFTLWFDVIKGQKIFVAWFGDSQSPAWQLNDTLSVIISVLLASFALTVRHVFILKEALDKLDELTSALNKELLLKKQRQKLEALGEMSGGLAHEINNSLQPIIAYAEIIESTYEKDPKLNKYAKSILRGSLHARNIVDTVLNFSRREPNVVHSIGNLYDLLDESLELVKDITPETIKINYNKNQKNDERNIPVQFDKTTFTQIITNLVKNSSHAMHNKGKIDISIGKISFTEELAEDKELTPGKYVTISVTDTGEGMDEKTMELIFTPFFTTKEEGEGTGLGLSIVYGIIQGAGGNIIVESKPSQGTTFTIYLPILNAKE